MVQPLHAWQEERTQHWRQGHRHKHRSQHRGDIGNAQRRKQASFDARQREQRHKNQHNDHRRIDDTRAHLDTRPQHDLEYCQRVARRAVLFQPAHDIFDIDDCVIDQFADGDRNTAQRHHIDRLTQQAEDQRSHRQ